MSFLQFHPIVQDWFNTTFDEPTKVQLDAWKEIKKGNDTLIAAPTGSGKTLAAFLSSINDLVEQGTSGFLEDQVQIVYVSPLRALSNDIEKNLQQPIQGITQRLEELGNLHTQIRTFVRTGDTTSSERTKMLKASTTHFSNHS